MVQTWGNQTENEIIKQKNEINIKKYQYLKRDQIKEEWHHNYDHVKTAPNNDVIITAVFWMTESEDSPKNGITITNLLSVSLTMSVITSFEVICSVWLLIYLMNQLHYLNMIMYWTLYCVITSFLIVFSAKDVLCITFKVFF